MQKFDLGIIGGGPAGYTTALYAAKQGKAVVLFEKDELGGTCLNRGCIPTKAFMHVADLYSEMKNSSSLGILCENLKLDFEKVTEYKNNVVNKLRKSLELVLKNSKITVVKEEAELLDKHTIQTLSDKFECEEVIIATGSVPREIKGLEFDHKFILSSDDILNMSKLPESILIIGSGAIGIEWTRILSSFGVEVTLIELADRLSPISDWEVSKRIERMFKLKKIKYFTSCQVEKFDGKKVILSNGEIIEPECVLSAVGRKINAPENKFEVKCIGDVSAEIQLAHYAVSQAKEHILNIPFRRDLIPSVVYGTPEIAWAGVVSKSKEDDENYERVMFPISALGKAHCDNNIDGFIKILAKDNKIKGVSIISKEASSLLQQMIIAMQNDITIDKLKEVCFAHPTYSEGISEGIMNL